MYSLEWIYVKLTFNYAIKLLKFLKINFVQNFADGEGRLKVKIK